MLKNLSCFSFNWRGQGHHKHMKLLIIIVGKNHYHQAYHITYDACFFPGSKQPNDSLGFSLTAQSCLMISALSLKQHGQSFKRTLDKSNF